MLKSQINKGDYIKFEYPGDGVVLAKVIRINKTTVTAVENKIVNGGVPQYRVPFRLVSPA